MTYRFAVNALTIALRGYVPIFEKKNEFIKIHLIYVHLDRKYVTI